MNPEEEVRLALAVKAERERCVAIVSAELKRCQYILDGGSAERACERLIEAIRGTKDKVIRP